MSNSRSEFVHAQLACIIEVLANTAVAQICKLVDDGYASLRMEISQNQREIDNLRRKLLVAKCQGSRRNHLERIALRRTVGVGGRSRARKPDLIVVDEEYELPVTVNLESVARNKHKHIQPPDTHDRQTLELSNPFKEPESTSHCIERDNQDPKSSHKLNRNADQRFSLLLHHVPQHNNNNNNNNQQCFREINWETCPPSSSTNGVFTSLSQWQEDISHTWNNADKSPYNPIPETCAGQSPHCPPLDTCGSQIKPEAIQGPLGSDGAEIGFSGDMGDVVSKLDWEPDGSVPVKVEEDECSQENKTKEELRPGRIERREGGERGFGGRQGVDGKDGGAIGQLREQVTDPEMGDNYTEGQSGLSCSSTGALIRLPNHLLPSAGLPHSLGSGGGNRFRCEVCGKTFTRIPLLRSHQRVHTGEKPFGCRHCSKRFSHRHQMNNHERIHTGEKPFSCPVCGRRFVQSNHVKRHLHIHTEQGSKL